MGNTTSTPQIEPPDHDSSSSTHDATPTPSKFETILDDALTKYAHVMGYDLRNHPLASEIDRHDPLDKIVAIFQEQAEELDDFRNDDPRLIRWLVPVVSHLHNIFSKPAAMTGVDLLFPSAKRIFSAIGVLLSTAKSVPESYGALVEIFKCVDNFLLRLSIYTEIEEPTDAMTEAVIKIIAELISVLALATKQIKRRKFKKYGKKLLGEKEIEAVLQRLDRLTLEESKVTVACTIDIVHWLVKSMEVVMEDGKASLGDIRTTLVLMQETAMNVNKTERDQLQEKFRRWLSPPDPWTNYDIAREALHKDTATGAWLTQGDIMKKWKSTGPLLWVQGLPGSGKTIISSSIIKDIQDMCLPGLDTLSIFYFDFRDRNKQDARNLLSSVLIQLCQQSNQFSKILSSVYSDHGDGSWKPEISTLLGCLKTMLAVQGRGTHYIVVDALDESPNSSGPPPRRQLVLEILKELIELNLPHTRFCVTSRPEADIRSVLEAFNAYNVSLQDQGQIKDLCEYVKSVVHSDATMRNWPEDVKEMVIDTLSKRSRGMFRWAYSQLEILRQYPVRDISTALKILPKSLDATYERILEDIPQMLQEDAHRIFQFLAVSSRPLRVEELAEVFAFDFGVETSELPKFDRTWRPSDAEIAVLHACSSLVTIVNVHGKNVAQFSHYSVREYLTSDRIAYSPHISHFYIPLKAAHTLLAKTCLSALCQLDDSLEEAKIQESPLALYAAEHWLDHARFEDVSSDIRDAMGYLFAKDKPHLAAWLWLHDVDDSRRQDDDSPHPTHPDTVPLYYAALCGLHNLSGRLLDAYPEDVNTRGGYHVTPLLASLNRGHPDIALLLLERGADTVPRGRQDRTALYVASSRGYVEVVRSLIDRGVDLNVECGDTDNGWREVKWTPLHVASKNGRLEVARLLLEHGIDVNYQDNCGRGALHIASRHASDDLVRLLLDHGANPNALDNWEKTALHEPSSIGRITIVKSLLEYRANVDAQSKWGWTPLHYAARDGHVQVVEVLLKNDADPHARTREGETPFRLASSSRLNRTQIMRLLSERTGEKM